MNQKLIQLDSNRRQLRSRLLNQSIVMPVVEGVFEQIVLYGQEMSSKNILRVDTKKNRYKIATTAAEFHLPYNKLPGMHIIFLVLLGLVLGNVILDCQDSKGLLLLDFLSLYRLTESPVFYP